MLANLWLSILFVCKKNNFVFLRFCFFNLLFFSFEVVQVHFLFLTFLSVEGGYTHWQYGMISFPSYCFGFSVDFLRLKVQKQ
jgi:hypothetical protein